MSWMRAARFFRPSRGPWPGLPVSTRMDSPAGVTMRGSGAPFHIRPINVERAGGLHGGGGGEGKDKTQKFGGDFAHGF